MKKIITCLVACLATLTTFAIEIPVETRVTSVTIYHSGALVNRTSTTEIKTGVHELVFKNVSSKMVLNSLKINNKEVTVLNKTLVRKLTKEEFNQLMDKKEVLAKQIALVELKYNEAGFITKVEDLEKMTAFYADKMLRMKKELRAIEVSIEEAKKLDEVELKNDNAAILKLIVSVDAKLTGELEIQYVCGGVGWSPAYEVNVVSSGQKTIEIKYLARAMSQTGEDWDNVRLHLSSSFPLESPNDLPRATSPWVLNGNSYNYTQPHNDYKEQNAEQQQIDRLEGVQYNELRIPSYLKLRTLKEKYSIKSNSTVFTFPIQTVNLPAYYYYYGFPSLDPEVYLVANVTGWDTLGFVDGVANISFGGNNIGKSIIKFSESRDTLLLPIGKDNSVYLKRMEIADQKYFKETTIGKKRKSTMAYRFELKNNNSFPVKFELIDQVPISQTKLAQVEIEKTSNGNLNRETGEVVWNFDIKPGQTTDKELIFTIEMDASYRYHKGYEHKKFRTISCPSF